MILDFGKYKGRSVEDAPISYILFLAGHRMKGPRKTREESPACSWVQKNKASTCEFAQSYLRDKCYHCGKKIVPIGNSRANGATHDDWNGRYLHKKCWVELKSEDDYDDSD